MEAEWNNGLLVKGFPLRLDARRPVHEAMVTHAHMDHIAAHRRVVCTGMTARLMRMRFWDRA